MRSPPDAPSTTFDNNSHSLPLAMKYSQNVEIAIGTFEAKENTFLGIARPDVASALGSK